MGPLSLAQGDKFVNSGWKKLQLGCISSYTAEITTTISYWWLLYSQCPCTRDITELHGVSDIMNNRHITWISSLLATRSQGMSCHYFGPAYLVGFDWCITRVSCPFGRIHSIYESLTVVITDSPMAMIWIRVKMYSNIAMFEMCNDCFRHLGTM